MNKFELGKLMGRLEEQFKNSPECLQELDNLSNALQDLDMVQAHAYYNTFLKYANPELPISESAQMLIAFIESQTLPSTINNNPVDYSEIPIEDLDMSIRTYFSLKRRNINYVSDIINTDLEQAGVGDISRKEIAFTLYKKFKIQSSSI